jgi:hypothetical protein
LIPHLVFSYQIIAVTFPPFIASRKQVVENIFACGIPASMASSIFGSFAFASKKLVLLYPSAGPISVRVKPFAAREVIFA